MNAVPEKTEPNVERWTLLRDIAVLQVKLIVDGVRDLLLVPLSLIAGIVSLVSGRDGEHGSKFYQLLVFGKQTERWINLFGAVENAPEKIEQVEPFTSGNIDELVGKFESFVVDEYKRGGVTAQAKEHFDKFIAAVQRADKKAQSS